MSLLGIDVGTTGCKAAAFDSRGNLIGAAYQEYDVLRPAQGRAELDSLEVWGKIKHTIQNVVAQTNSDPVTALSVSSMGEAVVPVTWTRQILGPSILNFDMRGESYLAELQASLNAEQLYRLNGNKLGNHYSLTKLKWIRQHQPDLYRRADLWLHWSSFVSFMLGADPKLDFTLANRTLLFDLDQGNWSKELLDWAGLERDRLPVLVPSGTLIGQVSRAMADELGLAKNVAIVSGTHDQSANALGCGVIREGQAVYGMGTFVCITPVFNQRRDPQVMLQLKLNTEHHAVPGKYVCFIYNLGGSIVKWYRDTFGNLEHHLACEAGKDVYVDLFAELAPGPSPLLVAPHFSSTGPPCDLSDSNGVISGLSLETTRADILKAILEANVFSLKEVVEKLPSADIKITEYRAAGGGSKSDAGLQICADILGSPVIRPACQEAGTLGAAILAGIGTGLFSSFNQAVAESVKLERVFEPDIQNKFAYQERYQQYQELLTILNPLFEVQGRH